MSSSMGRKSIDVFQSIVFRFISLGQKLVVQKNREVRKGNKHLLKTYQDFPGGPVVKNPPANAGHTGSSPGLGRSHMPRSN